MTVVIPAPSEFEYEKSDTAGKAKLSERCRYVLAEACAFVDCAPTFGKQN